MRDEVAPSRIGFVGVGAMGEPMVHRLLAAGHEVTVIARRDDLRDRLRHTGATVVDTAAEAAAGVEVVVSCLYSDSQLDAVARGRHGLLAAMDSGAVLVSHTTGTRATLDALLDARPDVHVVDAPVSGTASDVRDGRLTVLLGARGAVAAVAERVVRAYASEVVVTGGLGSALGVKLINNLLLAANAQMAAAAAAVADQWGIDTDLFLDAVAVCSGDSEAARHVRALGGFDEFASRAGPVLRKDVTAAIDAVPDSVALESLTEVVRRGALRLAGPLV